MKTQTRSCVYKGDAVAQAANTSCMLLAGLSVATVLLPIGMLYDWIVADVKPYEQDEFWILMVLVGVQCVLFWFNAFLYFNCFLKHKELLATEILKHCQSHEQLFSYWDRVQAHLWEYWICHEIVLYELTKGLLSFAVAAWILWDVTLIIIGILVTLFVVCHFANLTFWAGMMHLDRAWVSFFERRGFDWIRHRLLLKHYRRWATVVLLGTSLIHKMYTASADRIRGPLYFGSRMFFMFTMALTSTIAPLLIVPLLTSP